MGSGHTALQVPEINPLATRRGERSAVRGEDHGGHRPVMALEVENRADPFQVVNHNSSRFTNRCQRIAAGGKGHGASGFLAVDLATSALKPYPGLPRDLLRVWAGENRVHVPEENISHTRHCEGLTVGGEADVGSDSLRRKAGAAIDKGRAANDQVKAANPVLDRGKAHPAIATQRQEFAIRRDREGGKHAIPATYRPTVS